MFDLYRCNDLAGNSNLLPISPMSNRQEAWLIPGTWGLYDHGRRLITDSGYFRGPDPELVNGQYSVGRSWPREFLTAPEHEEYYFIGPMHTHYGHFLLSTFSRLWALQNATGRKRKLVAYNVVNPANQGFVVELLKAVGYELADCITFSAPTRFPKIDIPAPCFEESNYVHAAYRELCLKVASALLIRTTPDPKPDPIYLAKYALSGGVAKLDNEEAVALALARRGVEIVFPERLSLAAQVRLFSDRVNIAGLLGSAFHTASFVTARRLMMMAYSNRINSNQIMIDKVMNHDALYLFPRKGVSNRRADEFSIVYSLNDPEGVAESFLRIFDSFMGCPLLERSPELLPDLLAPSVAGTRNIAVGRRTSQSSISSNQSRGMDKAEDSRGAVSGFCTGSFQFHTNASSTPWWEVDLGKTVPVAEVRIFNRMDSCSERAAQFTISFSTDGTTWVEVHRRLDTSPFGGINGRPFSWIPSKFLPARHVRITLLEATFLHLDQVAVYAVEGEVTRSVTLLA